MAPDKALNIKDPFQQDVYGAELFSQIQKYDKEKTVDYLLIQKAFELAKKYHEGQTRKSGEPYYSHPVAVASILTEFECSTDMLCAALLHDTVEDTKVSVNLICLLFGSNIALLVDKLTKLDGDLIKLKLSGIESHTKLIQAIHKNDKMHLLIKLVDRLHNMQTIKYKTIEKQKKTAQETLLTFIPISRYVGIKKIELELEAIVFSVLNC